MRHALILSLVLLAGCGGSAAAPESTPRPGPPAGLTDALYAAAEVSGYCAAKLTGEGPLVARAGKAVDTLVETYKASPGPEVRKELRDAANTLRDCDEPGLADRLNRLTD